MINVKNEKIQVICRDRAKGQNRECYQEKVSGGSLVHHSIHPKKKIK